MVVAPALPPKQQGMLNIIYEVLNEMSIPVVAVLDSVHRLPSLTRRLLCVTYVAQAMFSTEMRDRVAKGSRVVENTGALFLHPTGLWARGTF